MESESTYDFPQKGIHRHVSDYIRSLPDLSGKVVLDIPCGDGRASLEFMKKGAEVRALDLFPDFMKLEEVEAGYADLAEPLPLDDNSVDFVICQEGIEHVSDQHRVLAEFSRVLKKGGMLLITTPNYSNVRSRLAQFVIESDFWKRMPPTEVDSIWFAEDGSNRIYFGHLFLIGVQRLKSLSSFTGFTLERNIRTDISNSSLLFGLLLYPLIAVSSLLTYVVYRDENRQVERSRRRSVLWSRVRLNLDPATLFCKHTFWVLRKEHNLSSVIDELKGMHRK